MEFPVGHKQPIVKPTCPCPSSPYVGFLCFGNHWLSRGNGKCFSSTEVLKLCLSTLVWVLLWGKSIGLNPNQVRPNSQSLSFRELSPSDASSDTGEMSAQRSQLRTRITKKLSLFVNNRRITVWETHAVAGSRIWDRLYLWTRSINRGSPGRVQTISSLVRGWGVVLGGCSLVRR